VEERPFRAASAMLGSDGLQALLSRDKGLKAQILFAITRLSAPLSRMRTVDLGGPYNIARPTRNFHLSTVKLR
jgi:hypothetical protein